MSHYAALSDSELIKDLVDNCSPLRDTTSGSGMGCLSPPEAPPGQVSVREFPRGKSNNLPVNGNKSQPQTFSHLVIHTHHMANAAQSQKHHQGKAS